MIIFINPFASAGRAQKKWITIESFISENFDPVQIVLLSKENRLEKCIPEFINQGYREFVAGGGDGTFNLLLQNIINFATPLQLNQIKIGAIGLGSSNDLHKPFKVKNTIKKVPYLLDFNSSQLRDIGALSYIDDTGIKHKRYWLINASIGITAQANLFFNNPDLVLHYLKKTLTNSAILYAALKTIIFYRNKQINVKIGNQKSNHINLTNMGVVKSPYFSGNLAYDTPFKKDNGQFYVNISRDMHLLNTLSLLWNLSQHRFCGLPKTETRHSSHIKVTAEQPFAVEFDGEVIATQNAEFFINKSKIGVCIC